MLDVYASLAVSVIVEMLFQRFFPTLLGTKLLCKQWILVMFWHDDNKNVKIWVMACNSRITAETVASPDKKPWVKPSWLHHGWSRCPGAEITKLLFLHLGWMASMLSLAAWRKDWTWSWKWSLSVPGLGEPPRGSLSQTAESSCEIPMWTRS